MAPFSESISTTTTKKGGEKKGGNGSKNKGKTETNWAEFNASNRRKTDAIAFGVLMERNGQLQTHVLANL